MQFTLITPKGKIYTFFIQAVAEAYQRALGDVITTPEVFDTATQVA